MTEVPPKDSFSPVSAVEVADYFGDASVVNEYAEAALWIGLWRSEKAIFQRIFAPHMRLLEVGCGAGRISIGLWKLGYRHLEGIDVCAPMAHKAAELAQSLGIPDTEARFAHADATDLKEFAQNSFDGAIFGFNGLMQIPGRARRRKAMAQIRNVVAPEGVFVFTTHDRANPFYAEFWKAETAKWDKGEQDPVLTDFGDRWYDSPLGHVFMHVPSREEILEDLAQTGWAHVADHARCELADEPSEVRAFSDECRFWVARNG